MTKVALLLAVLAAACLLASVFGMSGEVLGQSYRVIGAFLAVAALLTFMVGLATTKRRGVTELGRLG